jgi:hypothetical protein
MTRASATWLQAYLQALCEYPQFTAAKSVVPLWLAHEGGAEPADHSTLAPHRVSPSRWPLSYSRVWR